MTFAKIGTFIRNITTELANVVQFHIIITIEGLAGLSENFTPCLLTLLTRLKGHGLTFEYLQFFIISCQKIYSDLRP